MTGDVLKPFRAEDWDEDDLQRVRKFTIPMRWLVTKLFMGSRRVRNETHLVVEHHELNLPAGFKVCGAYLSPGGFGVEVYVTHPSFAPTSIHDPVPSLFDDGVPMFNVVALRLADPETPAETELVERLLDAKLTPRQIEIVSEAAADPVVRLSDTRSFLPEELK